MSPLSRGDSQRLDIVITEEHGLALPSVRFVDSQSAGKLRVLTWTALLLDVCEDVVGRD